MNKPHVHAELIKAWADGAEIETYNNSVGEWVNCSQPFWFEDAKYRIKTSITHRIGNRYSYEGSQYILAQSGPSEVFLISIEGSDVGNRWSDPILVKTAYEISQEEFNRICSFEDGFELITE